MFVEILSPMDLYIGVFYYSLSGNKTGFVRVKYLCLKRRIFKKKGIEQVFGVSKHEL